MIYKKFQELELSALEGATILCAPREDVVEFGEGVDVCALNGAAALFGKCATADAIYHPRIHDIALAIESFEAHTVGVEWQKRRTLPYELHCSVRLQCVKNGYIGKVTFACCGK